MSTLSQPATPRNTKARTATSPKEIYGGEHLPVLIQLPDLAAEDHGLRPVTQSLGVAAEEPETTDERSSIRLADLESDADLEEAAVPENGIGEPQVSAPREPGLREQRQQRRERVTRRSERIASMPAWLRGMSQLAFAALLAGVLLAIVVTLKNWNAPTRTDSERPKGVPFVEMTPPALAPPALAPADSQDAFTGPAAAGPTLGPPTFTGRASSPEDPVREDTGLQYVPPASPAFDRRGHSEPASYGGQPSPANAIPALPGATGHTAATIEYPTTGVEPVSSAASVSAEHVGRGWSKTLPSGPVHSAERPAPPTYNQQYNQYR